MRIVTYESERRARAGVLTGDDAIVDAWDALGGDGSSVRELLAGERMEDLARAIEDAQPLPLSGVTLLPPVPDPEKILCIGLNYRSHAEETKQEIPGVPTVFAKFRNALAAPGAEVELPKASDKVDYEAEICIVIGKRLKEVDADAALAGVAGYTLMNDLSARDLQLATTQWISGKSFDGAAPCGPALVTADEAGAHDQIDFKLTLNGEEMQSSSTSDLIFKAPELVSHLSKLMTLEPGDLISTGTPSGVGIARKPSVWLKPGDEIEIRSPQLGLLATRIR
ncbi:MAG TPA: fumarylacetoacetate hydrolase family protein [Solirubrobacterales bacterium]|nr:fumarylacetoacetate hydrolase family protein [Solirubrobacterales bacterium]